MPPNLEDNPADQDQPLVVALAAVQEQLAQERERRKEERFIWIIVSLVLLDLFLLDKRDSTAIVVSIFSLELIALVVVVRRLGVKNAAVFIDRVTSAIIKKETD